MNPAVMTGYQGVSDRDEPYNGPWDSSEALNQGRRDATPPHTYGAPEELRRAKGTGPAPKARRHKKVLEGSITGGR